MSKNLFQDIKKTNIERKNNIPTRSSVVERAELKRAEVNDHNHIYNNNEEQKVSNSRYTLWIVALISLVFLFFALSFLFSKATVTVVPKIKILQLEQNLSAVKDSSTGKLQFNLIVLSDEESKLIESGEERDFKETAKGKALIYNNFSSSPLTLNIDTRLEGSNGKLYKTKTKITVPGMSKTGVPGKIGVDIYASMPGSEYNSTPLDFKIFGFKGTSKYSKVYGRSVGEISGGLLGKSRQVTEEDKISAQKELEKSLESKLFGKALNQIPEGFVLFKNSAFLNVDDINISTVSEDGSVTIVAKGTLYGFIFNENDLTKKIIESALPDDNIENVYISNIKDLVFNILNKEDIIFGDVKNIDFSLSGIPKIVYKFDSEQLISDLVSRNKSDLNQILLQYPNIDEATLSIKPIWKSSFPDKNKDIKIIVNYPQ